MGILEEARGLAEEKLGDDLDGLAVERIVAGLFFTGVKLSNGSGGVCFTPVKDIPQAVCCPSSAGRIFDPLGYRGMKAGDVLEALSGEEPIKRAVAVAALNALSATCWERGLGGEYAMHLHMDAQDAVSMPKGASVAVVGALVPTMRALKKRGGTWWVIEQDPRTLKEDELPHYVPVEEAARVVSEADVLVITGATVVNGSLEEILEKAKEGAEIAVLGPTAGFLPEPLFSRGVRIVGGVWVRRTDELLEVLAAGGSGYHFFDRLADRIVMEKGR